MYYRIWGKTYFKGAKRIRPHMIQINFQSLKNDNFPTQETKKHLICKKIKRVRSEQTLRTQ